MYRAESEEEKPQRWPIILPAAFSIIGVLAIVSWWLSVGKIADSPSNRKQVTAQEIDFLFAKCQMSKSDVYTARNGKVALRPNRRRILEDQCKGISNGLIVPASSDCPFLMVVYPFKDGTYDIVSNSVRLSGLWEPQESSIIQSLPRPSFFVDIGANIGWHSLLALSLGHRVVAFEPLHSNVNLLQHSLCLNPGLRENLELHTVALTDQKQHDCRIAFQDSNAGNGVLLCGNQSNGDPRGVEQNAEKTKIGRLDDYLHPGQDIDLIKVRREW